MIETDAWPNPDDLKERRALGLQVAQLGWIRDLLRQVAVRLGALVVCLIVSGCAPEAPALPDPDPWARPLGDGARELVHVRVPHAQRTRTIRAVRDLTIVERGEDDGYFIGDRAPHVTVDGAGRIYVADAGNQRVLVYDAAGTHVRTVGRAGEGPGEFAFPLAAIVAGDRLFVSDTQRSRLSRWTLDGQLEWDIRMNLFPGYLISPAFGLADGTWLVRYRISRTATEVVAHMSPGGDRLAEIAPIEVPTRTGYPPDNPRLMIFAGATHPTFAPDPAGGAYVSQLDDYQVFSYGLDGRIRWALQAPGERAPVDVAEKGWATEWFRGQGYVDAQVGEIDWLESRYALADLRTDGLGRLYVFPYVSRGVEHERLPVDVYAPDGERLFAGWLQGDIADLFWTGGWKPGPLLSLGWQTARGDHVYGAREDPITGVYEVVRYRLEWPG